MLIMVYNVWKTVVGAKPVDAPILAPSAAHA
jgi:cbb3-type cytochrome oxidase subunit 1